MSDSKLSLRPATQDDLPALARLARETWLAAYTGIVPDAQIEYMLAQRYNLEALSEILAAPDKWLELAFWEERLAGFALSEPYDARARKLDRLYIHPDWQRRGVGGALVRQAAERARNLGYSELILSVNKRNEQAQRAYRKYGFLQREATQTDIGEGFIMDDYILALKL
ncbi:MAG: GNAT family N-acetyltransferase [Zoogloeaceae bacterium]|jgi:ribosomal protein S18 acetylase RimI-like enzyme|nr:GNAT family N-acetyltransferase [Zoogloeaceae bacterium]